MKARVKATGEIVEIIRNSAFDKDVFYDSNGQKYNREELSFDFKEKSFPKDTPDYWEKLLHQYAGMAMQGILTNEKTMLDLHRAFGKNESMDVTISEFAIDIANTLVEKLKKE